MFGIFTLHSLAGGGFLWNVYLTFLSGGRLCLEYLHSLGTRKLTRVEIREEYPTKFCKLFEPMTGGLRFIQLFDTLFDTPKVSLITSSFQSDHLFFSFYLFSPGYCCLSGPEFLSLPQLMNPSSRSMCAVW